MKNFLDYKPAVWFRNGHIQSVLPSLFRKIEDLNYQRERIETPDDDFLDLDWSCEGGRILAVISHGLEGSSNRAYVKGMVRAMNQANVDCLAWNFRSCSGEPNRQLRMYHNGSTEDLDLVVSHAIKKGYEKIVLVGFSMGGNLSLLYLGEQSDNIYEQVKGAVAFSAPVDLMDSSKQLSLSSNKIYMKRFLRMLHGKIKYKMAMFPDKINDIGYNKIKNFKDFDDRYTAPMHGFKDAEDYWEKCSSVPLLKRIKIPTLIVNAEDDPFLGDGCYPSKEILNENVSLEIPKYGGHVGFIDEKINCTYWSEKRAVEFVKILF